MPIALKMDFLFESDLTLIRRIDELHIRNTNSEADYLSVKDSQQAVLHISMLIQRMGIHELYRVPNTIKRHPAHKFNPYLLCDLDIFHPNHLWATDITYNPMKRGFVYLITFMYWASRQRLSWRLSYTLMSDFCIDAMLAACLT